MAFLRDARRPTDDILVVLDFMDQSINYLDSLDWVERYAWFGFFVSVRFPASVPGHIVAVPD